MKRKRLARLGDSFVRLLGKAPVEGDCLSASFAIPPARCAHSALTSADLFHGLVIVSTLPNIQKNACLAQILDLEKLAPQMVGKARLVHISADEAHHWQEVDEYHPDVRTPGYTLHGAEESSQEAFKRAFGVGVEGHRRIAHGLFAILNGKMIASEIPTDQMRAPNVGRFLSKVASLLKHRWPLT